MDVISYSHASQAHERVDQANIQIDSLLTTISQLQTTISNMQIIIESLQGGSGGSTGTVDGSLYSSAVQTSNTNTRYIDKYNTKEYKIYVSNNSIALEEIEPMVQEAPITQ